LKNLFHAVSSRYLGRAGAARSQFVDFRLDLHELHALQAAVN
jgi:hypothetical protein